MDNKIKVIVSTVENRTSGKLGIDELKEVTKKADISFSLIKWLNYGTAVVEVDCDFERFSQICNKTIFIRHIFPVLFEYDVKTAIKDIKKDLAEDCLNIKEIEGKTVGVQGYSIVDNDYFKKLDFVNVVDEYFEENSFKVNKKEAQYVVSFVMAKDTIYVGGSLVKYNLSNWILGYVRYKKEKDLISRASLKLEEAFETFNIPNSYSRAVDLGASPGGWTKVLADRGMKVYAVDPAKLDDRLKGYKKVKFFNMLSQEFVSTVKDEFDFIVNDMKMDVVKSAEITCELAKVMEDGALGIMTFKLPEKKQKGKILDGIRALSKEYEVIKVKQLFHNRQEVTVLFKKKGR